jgi:integrase
MGKLYRSNTGNWTGLVQLADGGHVRKTFTSRDAAASWIRRVDSWRLGSAAAAEPGLSFNDAMSRYIREVSSAKSPLTCVAEIRRAKPLLKHFASLALESITAQQVAHYRNARLLERPEGRGCQGRTSISPSTVRIELALLSHLFTTAIKEWRLEHLRNPVALVRRPTPAHGRCRRLTPAEESRIRRKLKLMTSPLLHMAFTLAIETAMRLGEIRNLTLGAVRSNGRSLHLGQTKNGRARAVPLTERAADALATLVGMERPAGCDLLFPGRTDAQGHVRPYRLEFAWWRFKTELGLKDLRFHDLRHEAISRMVEGGLNDLEVASISGHSSIQMVQRYTHLRATKLVGKLDKLKLGRRGRAH